MKRNLFLGAILFGSLNAMHSQETCATAQPISPAVYMAGAITGTYNDQCWDFGNTTAGGQPMKGKWYKYTPNVNGTVTISSDYPENDGENYSDDTKISVFTGSCASLVCAHQADDNVESGTFLETLVFDVTANQDYYIQWDNFQNSKGFKFSLEFDADAMSPVSTPYEFNFDSNPFTAEGWTREINGGGGWNWLPNDTAHPSESGNGLVGAFGTNVANETWLFSRGIQLEAGQVIDISYYVRAMIIAGNGGQQGLKVTIGTAATVAAQTTELADYDNINGQTYLGHTDTFTAPADGVYYVCFHNIAPAHTVANSSMLLLDTFSVTEGTAGVKDNVFSNLKIYPNPAAGEITVTSSEAFFNTITITDLNGRIVKEHKTDSVNKAALSVGDLAAGIYVVKIASDKGEIIKKIIKS